MGGNRSAMYDYVHMHIWIFWDFTSNWQKIMGNLMWLFSDQSILMDPNSYLYSHWISFLWQKHRLYYTYIHDAFTNVHIHNNLWLNYLDNLTHLFTPSNIHVQIFAKTATVTVTATVTQFWLWGWYIGLLKFKKITCLHVTVNHVTYLYIEWLL